MNYTDGTTKRVAYDQSQLVEHGGITSNCKEGEEIEDSSKIEIYYAGNTATIQLYYSVLSDDTLVGIRVKNAPVKVAYLPSGEVFDPSGLILNLVYQTGEPVERAYGANDEDITFTDENGNALVPGVSSISDGTVVKVYYKALYETSFHLYSSKARDEEDIPLSISLSKTEEVRTVSESGKNEEFYLPGEKDPSDLNGLKVKITSSLSGVREIGIYEAINQNKVSVTKNRVNLEAPGIYTVGITYIEGNANLTAFYTVKVNEKDSTNVEIYENLTRSYYFKGSFVYPKVNEMTLRLTYDNGDVEYKGVNDSNFDYSKQYNTDKSIGKNKIDVRYGTAKTYYEITIVDVPVLTTDRTELKALSYDESHVDIYYSTDGSLPSRDKSSSKKYTGVIDLGDSAISKIKGIAYLKDDNGKILEEKYLADTSYSVPTDLVVRSVSLLDAPNTVSVSATEGYTLPESLKMKINYEDGHSQTLLVKDNLGRGITLDSDLSLVDRRKEGEYEIRLSYYSHDAAYLLKVLSSTSTPEPQSDDEKKIKKVEMIPDGIDYAYVGSYTYPTHTYNNEVYKRIKITYC